MRRTKKIFAFILSLVIVFGGIAGCNRSTGREKESNYVYVSFNLNGADSPASIDTIELIKGDLLYRPLDNKGNEIIPTHPDAYTFNGWRKESGTGEPWDFEQPVNSDMTLYAGWLIESDEDKAAKDAYDAALASWSEPGHVYIHYKRFKNIQSDYEQWGLWVWQREPVSGEGYLHNWSKYDLSGAVCDIDTNTEYNDGGKNRDSFVSYKNVTTLGFQIFVKSDFNNTDSFWTTDGGDTYITGFSVKMAAGPNGSLHIFATESIVAQYSYTLSGQEESSDPYAGIETGSAVSKVDIESSKTKYYSAETSQDFYKNAGVGYQIQVASFADSDGDGWGDIKGITENLDYLDSLNVQVLWLTPIQESDGYHGYDIVDYYAVKKEFGTINDYRELVYEAHKKGIRVLMDLVINHTSSRNTWFQNSTLLKKGVDSFGNEIDYRSFYTWRYGDEYKNKASWYPYSTYGYYYFTKFASNMPELNFDYQGTRDAMVDVALYWMSFGLDGFRIDATKHIYMEDEYFSETGEDDVIHQETGYSRNATKNINFFREFNARVKAVYPDAFLVGENLDGDTSNTMIYYESIDSQFNFHNYYELPRALRSPDGSAATVTAYANAKDYEAALKNYNLYRGGTEKYMAIDSTMTSNHDITRMLNHMVADDAYPLNSSNQNKILVTQSNAATAINRAKVYSAINLTLPGVSWIYYGDELGMSGMKTLNPNGTDNHADRWLRQPFKWSNSESNAKYKYTAGIEGDGITFDGFDIKWDDYNKNVLQGAYEQAQLQDSLLTHFKKLAKLKAENSILIYGDFKALDLGATLNKTVYAFSRTLGGKTFYVYHNLSQTSVSISASGANVVYPSGGSKTTLAAYGTLIVES